MADIFKYAILKAIPDARRGERVNVGVVVFRSDGVDVRFSALSKVRALARGDWPQYAERVRQRLFDAFQPGTSEDEFVRRYRLTESVIRISELGAFSAGTHDEYQGRVSEILSSLVALPTIPKKERSSRINTEIAAEFRRAKALATPRDLEQLYAHKVVQNFYISPEEGLKADFALRNGVLHATATLDLRYSNVDISRAALPALVLDKAVRVFGEDTKRYGVYATSRDVEVDFSAHINILNDYATKIFNWSKPEDRAEYTRTIYAAMSPSAGYRLV